MWVAAPVTRQEPCTPTDVVINTEPADAPQEQQDRTGCVGRNQLVERPLHHRRGLVSLEERKDDERRQRFGSNWSLKNLMNTVAAFKTE